MAASLGHMVSPAAATDSLYLLVEDTVFHVDRRSFLRDSEFFQELFDLPPKKGQSIEGSSTECPLRVEGIKKEDFAMLLRAMFPMYICQDDEITIEHWMTILHLLTMWRFKVGRESILKKLSKSDPCYKIALYRKFSLNAEEWLIPSVEVLACRDSPLTEAEAHVLGVADAVRVAAVRERYTCECRNRCTNGSACPRRTQWYASPHIGNVFKLPI